MLQKKAILTGGHREEQLKQQGGSKNRKNQTEETIQKKYLRLSSEKEKNKQQKQEFEELKKIIKILDSLQWGETPEIEQVTKKLSQNYGHSFDNTQGKLNFKFLLEYNAFLTDQNDWCGITKTLETISIFTLLKELTISNELRSILAKRWQMESISLEKALIINIFKSTINITNLIQNSRVNIPTIKDASILSYLTINAGLIKNKNTVINEIKSQAEIFHSLNPLPQIKNNEDRDGALKCLGLCPNANSEQIKKRYKKLAQIKHPDTLRAKGIPKEFESIATENFTQIKKAYDILLKRLS